MKIPTINTSKCLMELKLIQPPVLDILQNPKSMNLSLLEFNPTINEGFLSVGCPVLTQVSEVDRQQL
tara:strand:- start:12 stop:212 length:201 start_codon:yes stop_codon:yes gene_type:complete